MFVIAVLAPSHYAVPAPTLFLLITVVYAAALGGWRAGSASALISLLYLGWLLTNSGRAAQYQPLDRTLLTIGGVALPLGVLAGWVLHRTLQRERGHDWDEGAARAHGAGVLQARKGEDRRFRMLVEQVRDYAIFMVTPDGHHMTWNDGVRRLLGYDEAEFVGQHGIVIFTPEDRERGEPERELRTAKEEGRASDDRWLVRKDGSRFWATGITARVNDDEGRLIGFSKVLRDRTQEKEALERLGESEERLRVALHAARMGIWRWHLPTNTQRLDGSMARLLGLGRGEVVESYEQFREHIHPEDRAQVDAAFGEATQSGEDMHMEFRVVWPDGSIRWLMGHGQAVRGADGKPEYLTGAAIDVTERKTAEDRLLQAQRMDAVGHLAGGVAHEINNMMTAVLGFSALVLQRLRDDPLATEVRQIQRAADRAATITKQLLAFSRRQLLRPQVLDLNELVGGMEHMLRRMLGEDKVFALDLGADRGRVRADPSHMEQVLLNLALNARDAMPTGGTFTIRTRKVVMPHRVESKTTEDELPPGAYMLLGVTDTGLGMDAATRARVFEPFFTTKPVGQGTGLGLATAFGIVRQSGGTIRVYSAPGQGTTFNIYLPEVTDATEPTELDTTHRLERGRGNVLVVEDDSLVREVTCRTLQAQGYRCLEAANGDEALDLVRQGDHEIDVVVTDVIMPRMGGRELAEQMAELRPAIPVLFMSAYASHEVIRRGLLAPGAHFVQKPFAPEVLAGKLRELLNGVTPR
jgi:PAS domain S-box-containing protein